MITYHEKTRTYKLDTRHTSYIIGLADEEAFVGHVYYGKRIADDARYLLRTEEPPFVPSENNRDRGAFMDSFPCEFAGNGVGDYREGAVAIRDAAGHTAVSLTCQSHEILEGKPALPGMPSTFASGKESEPVQTLVLHLKDTVIDLEADLFYSVFYDEDVITRSVTVRNTSDETIHLTRLMSLCLDMDADDYELLTLHGSWARERQIDRHPIGYGRTNVASTKGESSHQEHPFLALVDRNATQTAGEVYGFQFLYSGNFLAQVEKNQFDSLRVLMGIHPTGFDFVLKPADTFAAPEVVMTYSAEGIGQMSRSFHDLIRTHLIRSPYRDTPRPVLINNWEATYFEFDTEKLLSIAREAKKSGIEMLVMDDGWFGHRNDDNTSLGDWFVNEEKLKGGLTYLVDEVNKIGLKFGIWFEPEMISPDSELYRAHPDYAIAIPNRTPTRSRNQYVLDLSRPEVVDFTYEQVAKILRSANIEYVKWDMNRQLTDLGSIYLDRENQGELSHRYVLAVYELQERLMREFPKLLLENCSGGGARFDGAMLYYSPQIWCSDDTDAIERLSIQEGTALIYPVSTMGAHVSDCPNHTVGRVTPFATRGDVALCGTFGYELDITKIPEEDRALIPQQIEKYHKYNGLIRSGDYYRIASYSENHLYDCYMIVSKDKQEALVSYAQVLGRPNVHSRRIRLQGLLPDARYRLEVEGEEEIFPIEKEGIASGDTLMHAGILIRGLYGDFKTQLIHLCKTS